MRTPVCSILSLALPAGYYLARTGKEATNMGEALAPFFVAAVVLTIAAAIVALFRWLSWIGVLLPPAAAVVVSTD